MMKHLFLTGDKGVGKSTLLKSLLKKTDATIGGFFTVKTDTVFPNGFSVHLLQAGTDEAASPANLLFICGVRDEFIAERFCHLGCAALTSRPHANLLIMDELGPHEAHALAFQEMVLRLLDGNTPIVGVLQKADSPFLDKITSHPRVHLVEVTTDNRDFLLEQLDLNRPDSWI